MSAGRLSTKGARGEMTTDQLMALLAGIRVHMPLHDISERSGVSRVHLWRLSTGQIRRPAFDTVERLQKINRDVSPMKPPRI